jgi:ribonuclease E
MKKEMLINVLQPEECRIAILEDGVLEELYVERTGHESYVGNIYKGRIVNIEPSIQAAFVDFGVGRNGFLHVSDVEPAYYKHLEQRRGEPNGRRGPNYRDRDQDRDRDRRRPPAGHEARPRRPEPVPIDKTDAPSSSGTENMAVDVAAISAAERTEDLTIVQSPRQQVEKHASDEPSKPAAIEEGAGAAPEAAETEPSKRRGRGRGRGRGRRGRGGEPTARKAPRTAENKETPAAELPPASEPMGSAEHRTHENDPSMPPLTNVSDDDLSFSLARPSDPLPAPSNIDETFAPPPFIQTQQPERTLAEAIPEAPAALQVEHGEGEPAADVDREEDFDDEYAEHSMSEFEEEEEDEASPRRRSRRDDRGGGRDRDRGRRGRRPGGGGRPGMGRPKPLIQDIFKRGQEVLVQVIKEGIGTKGPTLSTYISIAGRYLVLMPGLNRIGVSRKIDDDDQRRRLREILNELQPPKGLGFIIRTAGLDRTKKELQRDLAYLSRLWQVVVRRIRKMKAPAEIYQESDMIIRTIRDTFTSEIDTIWVDEPNAFEHAQEFLQIVMPRYANRIKCYSEPEPMFHKYGIEEEIARIQRRHVPLPYGGSIVIDQTEALVAIDVNSGNFRADNNAEETAYQMNLHAAKEIARQLRLRDLGGVIVNDFIDMRDEKHRRSVEKAMRDAVKRDRARTKILKISQFGIIEMTRQRIRPSLKRSVYQDCPHCTGTGQIKTTESMSIDVMRMLQLAAHRSTIQRVDIRVHQDVASYLLNRKRKAISHLEEAGNTVVYISGERAASPEMLEFVCFDNNNNEVKFQITEENHRPRRR